MPLCRRTAAALLSPLLLAAGPSQAPAMDPKALQAWMDAAAPVAAHARLKAYVGTWTTRQTDWLLTGDRWNEADGTATCRLILGGRFLQEDYATTLDGHPFHALGLTGFDRQRNTYVAQWLDDFGTGVIALEGAFDSKGRVLTLNGPSPSGFVGRHAALGWRVTDTWWDPDHHTVAWWGQGRDGRPVKVSEILYTRDR